MLELGFMPVVTTMAATTLDTGPPDGLTCWSYLGGKTVGCGTPVRGGATATLKSAECCA